VKEDKDVLDVSDDKSSRCAAADSYSSSSSDQDEHPSLPDNTVVDPPHTEDVEDSVQSDEENPVEDTLSTVPKWNRIPILYRKTSH
jgi:hypothetical protein